MPSKDTSGLLWLSSPGLPKGPECRDDALPPLHPFFVYPAAQLAVPRPGVARGPERVRGGE